MSQVLVKLADKLTPNQKKFIAEVIGTFILVVLATGSVVLDARINGVLGIIVIFGIEVLASALLMAVIFTVVY